MSHSCGRIRMGTGKLLIQECLSRSVTWRVKVAARSSDGNGSVTMAEIARHCGVSKGAVSHALRGNIGEVSEATRDRIRAAAIELGYDSSRNQAARRLALQKHGTRPVNHAVSIAMPQDYGVTYYARLLHGVSTALAEESYGVYVAVTRHKGQLLPLVCGRGEVDGLLVAVSAPLFAAVWLSSLRNEPNFGDRPIVGLVEPIPTCSSVHADDFQAGYLAASHLFELGHRYILHGFGFEDPLLKDGFRFTDVAHAKRMDGMKQACRDFGLDPVEHFFQAIAPTHEDYGAEEGPSMISVLREHPEITAIIAQNDSDAIPMLRLLSQIGLRVPEDISLVGFDDTDQIVSLTGDSLLTTVRIPLFDIGQEGARLLLRAINGKVKTVQNTVLPTELIVRETTAPPKHSG